ncbi:MULTISPECIES: ATP-dependent zinc protease family protein [Larsenimonas]|uniref:RimK/LysX family protein n=1 Tax=Larsenimonas suaedae TaxID=1851019 RepID=A0ABU1GY33_9GAMM|nr:MULTISPECIES: RimK/LysX family protein [Larsenimonas]MCM2972840.1 RimK/LysX family protein [Larsenimonas suaedae]MCM5704787.1 RimK/LysX family protein [Larsenimonas salina]MDR5896939.1 RimK/LysX family protein [Larsenimonas suaedae]
MTSLPYEPRAIVGRREIVTLPELELRLPCKVDTGARTSALHAENITPFERNGHWYVRFDSWSGDGEGASRHFELPLYDRRQVKSSNGHSENRCVIRTLMELGELSYDIELTLVDRQDMRHPMLLGRRAMRRLLVAPGASFLHGSP